MLNTEGGPQALNGKELGILTANGLFYTLYYKNGGYMLSTNDPATNNMGTWRVCWVVYCKDAATHRGKPRQFF